MYSYVFEIHRHIESHQSSLSCLARYNLWLMQLSSFLFFLPQKFHLDPKINTEDNLSCSRRSSLLLLPSSSWEIIEEGIRSWS